MLPVQNILKIYVWNLDMHLQVMGDTQIADCKYRNRITNAQLSPPKIDEELKFCENT